MNFTTTKESTQPKPSGTQGTAHRPEKKFVLPHGLSVAIWNNPIQTSDGTRHVRSLSIERRYRDPKTGEWATSSRLRPTDVPVVIYGLQRAFEYLLTRPSGMEAAEREEVSGAARRGEAAAR